MFSGVDKTVEALLRGQECANHLKMVFERTGLVPSEPLFDTLLDSFSDALSFFTNFTSSHLEPLHLESSQNTPARKSPKKKSYGEEGLEHYRDDSPTPLSNDGFSWRKYGQKKIMTSIHPRCYYRCAYAKDQNCNATKRVQQIQDSPSVYRTTYVGQHICDVNAFSQPDDEITNGSMMIRFDQIDEVMSDLVLPQHQEIIEERGPNQTMNQEFDNNEFMMNDEQFWGSQFPPFSPENFMSLDDLSVFDYNLFEV